MIPCVSAAPLSACPVVGIRIAYPQPFDSTCCCQVGPGCGGRGGVRPGGKTKLNSMITGTGPLALAGVVSVRSMLTAIAGYAELSTWPASFLTTTGTSPFFSLVAAVTSQVTLGVTLGTRP